MKKIVLTTVIILQATFLFGQKNDCSESGCGNKSNNITRCWGGPRAFDQSLQIRVKGPIENCYNAINSESGKHSFMWHIEINGLKKVRQDCKLYVTGGDSRVTDFMIVSNENGNILTDKMEVTFFTFSNAETINLEVKPLNNSSSSNNRPATTQQNDLTEYNRSKADLERQMQNENAKRQEEANRINNQSKQFVNVYNEGVDLQRRGNFKDAKDKYQQAAGLATNDTQRKQAKSAFDDMDKATRNETALNAIGDGLKQIGSALDKAHDEKQQKHRADMDEHNRKQAIIDEDKAINTLSDPKIFETYADYVAKNIESLNFPFEKIFYSTNIPNKEKNVALKFKGIMVTITNQWDGSSMSKYIYFKAESEKSYNNLKNSPFLESLKQLNPFYDNFSGKINSFDHINCIVFGLEKTQSFIEVYNNGYQSPTYKGFSKILNEFEKTTKQKLAKTDNSVDGLIEKAKIYRAGNNGVEKNYPKALELYQQAFDKSKDKEILLQIGNLHEENSNFDKAIEYFENYISNNENVNPIVYRSLGWIYSKTDSPFYNVEKAKNNFEKQISILEANYNKETEENKKNELKKNIASTYSILGLLYNYYGKNVVPEVSVVYYEKALQWDENDTRTAYDLMSLYAKDWKDGSFKRDTKKAKFWALKVCEIADRLEGKNSESYDAKIARMNCNTAKDHIKNNFKYLKK